MQNFRDFLKKLDKDGNLLHVRDELSPKFEVSAFLKNFDAGRAILFHKIKEYPCTIVGGICSTRERILKSLDLNEENFHSFLSKAIEEPILTKKIDDSPVNEIYEEPVLSNFPILTHYERDAGPYITCAIVSARIKGVENVSIHRLQILDDKHMAIRIVPRHLYRLCQIAFEYNDTLDVSISIGLHPALLLAASSPVPFNVSEFDVANKLMNGRLKLIKCKKVDVYAPSDAEIIMEGKILLNKKVLEGPFTDLTSTYDIKREQWIIEILGIMRRKNYIYQALLPASSEHKLLMGMPQETRVWRYTTNIVPNVKGINMTVGGCGWFHCVVSIDKLRDGDGKNILLGIFAANPSIKHAIVVDSDIDIHNMAEIEWAIATRFQGDKDLILIPNVRVSSLDPSSDQEMETGCKVGIDATRPFSKPKEKFEKAIIPLNENIKKILEKYQSSLLNASS